LHFFIAVFFVSWGTDLSFAFVSVRSLDPSGAAALSGQIRVGDQLCEINGSNVIGASFDVAMEILASLDYKSEKEVDLVFFRGTKDELKALCNSASTEPENITVTVIQNKGAPDQTTKFLTAKPGVNVRELLVENGINVYQSVTRWTNCNGKQLCGTCIVNIPQGGQSTNRKSVDEASTLRENPETYRLSCIIFAYGDVTVETFPPIQAAQWTR
jgi:ferredoxin